MRLSAETLWEPDGAESLTYLHGRGLTDEILREFNFGYCPAFLQHEMAGRIIMPLYDSYGNLIAVTSRKPDAPKKFQHWHESFDKGDFLFGLNVAKEHIYKSNKAIIVEGQFDTTCLHSFGFKQTVGLLGSSFNIIHVTQLARMCQDIFIVLDPDDSGDAGVERALDASKEYRLDDMAYEIYCIPVQMPPKTDPDQFVMQFGPKAFIDLLKKSKEKRFHGR